MAKKYKYKPKGSSKRKEHRSEPVLVPKPKALVDYDSTEDEDSAPKAGSKEEVANLREMFRNCPETLEILRTPEKIDNIGEAEQEGTESDNNPVPPPNAVEVIDLSSDDDGVIDLSGNESDAVSGPPSIMSDSSTDSQSEEADEEEQEDSETENDHEAELLMTGENDRYMQLAMFNDARSQRMERHLPTRWVHDAPVISSDEDDSLPPRVEFLGIRRSIDFPRPQEQVNDSGMGSEAEVEEPPRRRARISKSV